MNRSCRAATLCCALLAIVPWPRGTVGGVEGAGPAPVSNHTLAAMQPPVADALLFRIFLKDGSTLVSYGDYARVADKVVFSLPTRGVETSSPTLQLVSIAESSIDWERTGRYGDALRARRYSETQGEADFEKLSAQVAATLNAVTKTDDPSRRLALADAARRMLSEWPAAHYGYRATDVGQLRGLLDEVVSELRVAAGQSRFELDLVANPAPIADEPALPPPTLRESIEQLFSVAMAAEPGDRVSLLREVMTLLGQPADRADWRAPLRARASHELSVELRTERAYAEFVTRTVAAAEVRARRADVQGLQALVQSALKQDDALGRRRPQEISALLATLDARLAAAQQLRLARDAWELRLDAIRGYQRQIRSAHRRFERAVAGLEQIRQLSGPAPRQLLRLDEELFFAVRELRLATAPAGARPVHDLLTSALQLAVLAVSSRQTAIKSADMKVAWEASSAAAGALLLLERAQQELTKLTTPPSL